MNTSSQHSSLAHLPAPGQQPSATQRKQVKVVCHQEQDINSLLVSSDTTSNGIISYNIQDRRGRVEWGGTNLVHQLVIEMGHLQFTKTAYGLAKRMRMTDISSSQMYILLSSSQHTCIIHLTAH